MSALYEKSQLTKILISPASHQRNDGFRNLSRSELHHQRNSVHRWSEAGYRRNNALLDRAGEHQRSAFSVRNLSVRKLYKNPAQDALREAYDNDTTYAFRVIFPSGKGFKFRLKSASIPVFRYQRCSGGNVLLRLKVSLKASSLAPERSHEEY